MLITVQITEKNDAVESSPSLINKSCYEDGWLFKVSLSKPDELESLMDQQTYDKYLEDSHWRWLHHQNTRLHSDYLVEFSLIMYIVL